MEKTAIALLFLLAAPFAGAAECNISISISASRKIAGGRSKIEFYNKLSHTNFDYVIEYWVEDLEGNILKGKRNTTNQNRKTFTPKGTEGGVAIKAGIVGLGCDDIDLSDNFAEKRIFFGANQQSLASKTITVSYSVDKNTQKLKDFAAAMNRTAPKKQETGSNPKLKKSAPYFLVALTTLLSIVLIWKR